MLYECIGVGIGKREIFWIYVFILFDNLELNLYIKI